VSLIITLSIPFDSHPPYSCAVSFVHFFDTSEEPAMVFMLWVVIDVDIIEQLYYSRKANTTTELGLSRIPMASLSVLQPKIPCWKVPVCILYSIFPSADEISSLHHPVGMRPLLEHASQSY